MSNTQFSADVDVTETSNHKPKKTGAKIVVAWQSTKSSKVLKDPLIIPECTDFLEQRIQPETFPATYQRYLSLADDWYNQITDCNLAFKKAVPQTMFIYYMVDISGREFLC